MKTHHKLLFIGILSMYSIHFSWSQHNSSIFSETKETARISLSSSIIVSESKEIGNIFQKYIDKINKTSNKVDFKNFKLDSKSFSVYKEKGKNCLILSINFSMMLNYDSKKINAFLKALSPQKNKEQEFTMSLYIDS
ncbi:hypothetical protein Q4517_13345 [Tenacibaculum sp. 1_MG-2023]|uniref:hypothetical protein n=1 Tax=Tenacibaculum sp. 1_MG-2023 TaxID=3062653 RepID=UPI0026E2DB48|nr:hypothetical protein [Tenacibaculum sp. 1_MG-2023]MDO6676528.1 hypothetical protein [Tenacibaculum sp. 1_MG-2023]